MNSYQTGTIACQNQYFQIKVIFRRQRYAEIDWEEHKEKVGEHKGERWNGENGYFLTL